MSKLQSYNTIVINLFGGPGSGKSTAAAGIFYELKRRGFCCELVTEFAKDKVWEDSYRTLDDQVYLLGKQYHKMWRINKKVEFIITDACLVGGIAYNKEDMVYFDKFAVELYNQFNNKSYFINRGNTFEEVGRMQNEEQSKELDEKILDIFYSNGLQYSVVNQATAVSEIVSDIIDDYYKVIE